MLGFAHRGGRGHGADNTLEAFAAALARGATGLETDAWLTADGEVVLDHDGVLRQGRLRRIPMAHVRRTDLPAHIPTLRELYDACGTDFDLAVDVSLAPVGRAIADVATSYGAAPRLWLVAPHDTLLPDWRDHAPAVHLVRTLHARELVGRRGPAFAAAAAAGADAVNARWPWWRRTAVDAAHAAGLLAFGYDAQRRQSLRRCVLLGLDGVFSDHVDTMLQTLAATPA